MQVRRLMEPPLKIFPRHKKIRNPLARSMFVMHAGQPLTVAIRTAGAFMKSAITKRSVIIGGHKTSVSLEEPFWSAVREIAGSQDMTVSSLLRRIDLARRNTNLSSAIRVFVLENLRTQQTAAARNGTASGRATMSWRPDLGPA
jgi:predicted DNA-binding ribbon-helix-helix protein